MAPVAAEIMPGRPAGKGNDCGHAERGVQPHLRVESGDKEKGNRFRDQGQRDHETGKEIVSDIHPFTNFGNHLLYHQ